MTRRTNVGVRGLVVVSCLAAGPSSTANQESSVTGQWNLHINETRGPLRAGDPAPSARDASSEVLAGPTNGSDQGYLIFTRMPSGAHGPALFTLPDEHLYLVVEGVLNIRIGTDAFTVNRYEGVRLPANIPHEVWNAGPGSEAHLEVIAPGSSRDLLSMVNPAQPRTVENAAQYVRRPKVPAQADMRPGLNGVTYAARATGGTI